MLSCMYPGAVRPQPAQETCRKCLRRRPRAVFLLYRQQVAGMPAGCLFEMDRLAGGDDT